MAFSCAKGFKAECDGCGACTCLSPAEEDALEEAEDAQKAVYKELILPVMTKIDEIRERLEEAESRYQDAQDAIPAGLEETSEYSNLEHNLEAVQKALDYLIDVEEGVNELIG